MSRLGKLKGRVGAGLSRVAGPLQGWRVAQGRVPAGDYDFEGADLQPCVDFGRGAGLPQEAFRG